MFKQILIYLADVLRVQVLTIHVPLGNLYDASFHQLLDKSHLLRMRVKTENISTGKRTRTANTKASSAQKAD